MTHILRRLRVLDPHSEWNGKIVDLKLENGRISQLVPSSETQEFDENHNFHVVTPGWVDLWSDFCEPGFEFKEDIETGLQTAAESGFTLSCVVPNTNPVIETRADFRFLMERAQHGITSLYPYSALTKGLRGKELVEILDMHREGAVVFTDGNRILESTELLAKSLQYLKVFNGLLIVHADDPQIAIGKSMHEGLMSTQLGLKGFPSFSESSTVAKYLSVLEYAGGRIHFNQVSTAESIEHIRLAKKSGLSVTCDVSISQLVFTDADLVDFDPNHKVYPPYRTKKDQNAIMEAIEDGTVDAIVSAHRPQDDDSKMVDFESASFGSMTLPAVLPMLLTISKKISLEKAINCLTVGPRKVLGFEEMPGIQENSVANFTVYDPDEEWVLDSNTSSSKSGNSPFYHKKLKGRVQVVVNGEKAYFLEQLDHEKIP